MANFLSHTRLFPPSSVSENPCLDTPSLRHVWHLPDLECSWDNPVLVSVLCLSNLHLASAACPDHRMLQFWPKCKYDCIPWGMNNRVWERTPITVSRQACRAPIEHAKDLMAFMHACKVQNLRTNQVSHGPLRIYLYLLLKIKTSWYLTVILWGVDLFNLNKTMGSLWSPAASWFRRSVFSGKGAHNAQHPQQACLQSTLLWVSFVF